MAKIYTKNKVIILVDNENYDYLNKFSWHINSWGYVYRHIPKNRKSKISMHREIMGFPKDMCIDHINHNTLDNRKQNLRVCTLSQNGANQIKRKGLSSIFKGVTWDKSKNKWMAQIMIHKKHFYLGRYKDEIEAAKAYDKKAKIAFGEFAKLNLSIYG